MTYYNTNQAVGLMLSIHEINTLKQDELIFAVFRLNPSARFTPSEVDDLIPRAWPLTSTRRGISTLTKAGKLTKTSKLHLGPYGKNEHIWRLNDQTT